MGLDIKGIVEGEPRELSDFKGRRIAIDAYNALYQFLSSIRQPDGTHLLSPDGKVTSHLAGLLYRSTSLAEAGMWAVYVFDGEPHPLKSSTIEGRRQRRQEAEAEWHAALEEGDMERARTKAMQSTRLTSAMVEEAVALLDALGIPHVHAPGEGEAQASHMASKGDVWAAASQDYDSLLFGTPRLVRNLTISGRRKVPRRNIYVSVQPEMVESKGVLDALGITREQLVDLGILVGTDFNAGLKAIGPKKALKMIREFGSAEKVLSARGYEIPALDTVRELFLHPQVTDDYILRWRPPDRNRVLEFLCEARGFSKTRVEAAVEKIAAVERTGAQKSLDAWC
ncbi:MAG: flap endonuclease-1 [Candidatus Thermoplasmatota archaeon]